METGKNKPPEDITQQHYKGPSQAVAMLGEGAMQTKFLTLGGLAAGGIAAFMYPIQAAKFISSAKSSVTKASVSENALLKILGGLGKVTLEFGEHTAKAITEIKFVEKTLGQLDKKRFAVAFDGAIITSAVASIIGAVTGGGAGIASARAGRKQFDTAKEQVLNMRQKLAQKQKETDDLKIQIDDLKTQQAASKGLLKVSGDAEYTIVKEDAQETENVTSSAQTAADAADAAPAKNWRDTVTAKESVPNKTDAPNEKDTAEKNMTESFEKSHTESLGDKPAADWKQDMADKNAAKADQQLSL